MPILPKHSVFFHDFKLYRKTMIICFPAETSSTSTISHSYIVFPEYKSRTVLRTQDCKIVSFFFR